MNWQARTRRAPPPRGVGARDGRRRQGQAPARRRPAHGARAHRRADRQGSFHEIGAIAGKAEYDADNELAELTPSNCVMGRATVDGRPVVVIGDDFTVRGGSADATINEKPLMAERDGAASSACRSSASSRARAAAARSRRSRPPAAPTCPAASAPRAGFQYHRPRTWRSRAGGRAGPRLGRGPRRGAARRQPLLGDDQEPRRCSSPARRWWRASARTSASRSWAAGRSSPAPARVDEAVDTEEEAFDCARRFLSYLPSSVHDVPPRPATDDPDRREEILFDVIPRDRRKVYRMRPIIESRGRSGLLLRDGQEFRPLRHHRPRPARRPRRSRSWRAIPITTAAPGRPTPARRSCASSTWPRPSICRWSISATAPAS